MKIPAARVRTEVERPDPRRGGWLLFGPEAAETDALRVRLCDALLAAAGEGTELVRLPADAVRRDPAALRDARGAGGLFGGRPVILVEGAGDGAAEALAAALADAAPQDGPVVVVGGDLKPRSRLRRLFEEAADLAALGVYAAPPGRADLERWAQEAGAGPLAPEALETLAGIASGLATPEIRNLLNLLALYRIGENGPATPADILACAPQGEGGDLDAVAEAASARRPGPALAALARAWTRGASPTEAAMALGRWFRLVHRVCLARDPREAASRLRPPVYGPRQNALAAAGADWRPDKAETALAAILDTERSLRGIGPPGPDRALVERLTVRLATLR